MFWKNKIFFLVYITRQFFILNEEPDHLKKHMSVLTKSKNSAKTYLNIPFKKAKSSTSSVKETGQTQAQIEKKKTEFIYFTKTKLRLHFFF